MPFRTADAARMPVKQYLRKLSRRNAKTQHKFRLIRAEYCTCLGRKAVVLTLTAVDQSVWADLKELSHFCNHFSGIYPGEASLPSVLLNGADFVCEALNLLADNCLENGSSDTPWQSWSSI